MRKSMPILAAAATALTATCVAARESGGEAADDQQNTQPVLIEMFVSQACKSCPPASAYLTELARRPGVVALSWHIDYWNMLASRAFGRWQDPFSRPAFAERQRRYNKNIRNRSSVFTPQAIINGAESVVGSKREEVESIIHAEMSAPDDASIRMTPDDSGYAIRVTSKLDGAQEVYLVKFLQATETDVRGGDNAGMHIMDAHVVSEVTHLGAAPTGEADFRAPKPDRAMGCAVIVQAPDQGRVFAAQYCP
ncbi:MAG TPA: DUF1223 domain-containing protein [Amphiplicatus sp.]|nr:DUF1223 domain-containing protein [Amphiplicatus sp.]